MWPELCLLFRCCVAPVTMNSAMLYRCCGSRKRKGSPGISLSGGLWPWTVGWDVRKGVQDPPGGRFHGEFPKVKSSTALPERKADEIYKKV